MKGKLTRTERTLKSIELADKIESSENKIKCLTMLYALLEKFGDKVGTLKPVRVESINRPNN